MVAGRNDVRSNKSRAEPVNPKFTLTFRAITTAACSFVANYRWGTDYT
jgi:hypothetical protein